MTLRIAIYARVSSKDQADYGTSLKGQVDSMTTFAMAKGYTIVETVREDFPGYEFNRPGIDKVKRLADRREIDAILSYSRDRYGRGKVAPALLDEYFSRRNVRRLYVTREESTDTPDGELRDGIDDLFSGYERAKIRDRTMKGKADAAKEGRLTSGNVAYGYKRCKPNGRNADLVIDTDVISDIEGLMTRSQVILWIFIQWVYQSCTVVQILDALNMYGIPAPVSKKWRYPVLYDILRNRNYIGEFIYGKYRNVATDKRNAKGQIIRRKELRPEEEWIHINRPDLRIIDDELFQLAQDKLDNGRGAMPTRHKYLMNRRVMCANGHKMSSKTHEKPNGKVYQYYECSKDRWLTREKCSLRAFDANRVDRAIWEWVIDLVQDPERVLNGYRRSQEIALDNNRDALETIAACDRLIAQAEEELSYLIEEAKQFRNNARVREQYRKQIEEQSQRIELLQQEKAQHEAKVNHDVISDKEIAQRIETITSLSVDIDGLCDLDIDCKKELIEILGITAVLGVDKRHGPYADIVWYGETEKVHLYSVSSRPAGLRIVRHKLECHAGPVGAQA